MAKMKWQEWIDRHLGKLSSPPPPPLLAWHNMRTGEVEYLSGLPATFEDYIPQDATTQALYRVKQMRGLAPAQAALYVLELHEEIMRQRREQANEPA